MMNAKHDSEGRIENAVGDHWDMARDVGFKEGYAAGRKQECADLAAAAQAEHEANAGVL
jgi:hypothetical protein